MKCYGSVAVTLVCGLLLGASPTEAEEIAYDTGTLGMSMTRGWAKYWAVRFTNTNAAPVLLQAVKIRGHSSIVGRLDLFVWASSEGQPGDVLATLEYVYLSSTYFNSYDVSSSGVVIPPGGDIFAGFDSITCSVPYDTASGEGTRNWWMETTTWSQGAGSTRNLMVRLEVMPVAPLSKGTLFKFK
jgi:hypothetical protein